jgi:hypothetical protein
VNCYMECDKKKGAKGGVDGTQHRCIKTTVGKATGSDEKAMYLCISIGSYEVLINAMLATVLWHCSQVSRASQSSSSFMATFVTLGAFSTPLDKILLSSSLSMLVNNLC